MDLLFKRQGGTGIAAVKCGGNGIIVYSPNSWKFI